MWILKLADGAPTANVCDDQRLVLRSRCRGLTFKKGAVLMKEHMLREEPTDDHFQFKSPQNILGSFRPETSF